MLRVWDVELATGHWHAKFPEPTCLLSLLCEGVIPNIKLPGV